MRVTARRKKERERGRGAAAVHFLKTTRGNFLSEMLFRNGSNDCRDGDDGKLGMRGRIPQGVGEQQELSENTVVLCTAHVSNKLRESRAVGTDADG